MKWLLVNILVICVATFLQVNFVLAQTKSNRQKKISDYFKPKVKTEKIVGEIIAYNELSCAIRIDICYLFTIIKLEDSIKDNWFVRVSIPYGQNKERKELTKKRQKMELNVFQVSDDEILGEENSKDWKLLKGAKNETIPFGSNVPVYVSMGEIKKIKD